jgi:ubiquinone/menaquinone biosynthesis C-methylase UbiE
VRPPHECRLGGRGDIVQASAFDITAPTFERHRALPHGVRAAIRAAILRTIDAPSPRLLDLGAGTGRIGAAFVAAGDDYVGVDLSFPMLCEFARHGAARLVQADGARLPFGDAGFDAVMLIQVFGGMRRWRDVLAEARRVLRPAGALAIGRTVSPADGIDAQMRQRLGAILDEMGARSERMNVREDALHALERIAHGRRIEAAAWTDLRTPRAFLERHRAGARFAALPARIRYVAISRLGGWATAAFGSLDAAFSERRAFELNVFRFEPGADR